MKHHVRRFLLCSLTFRWTRKATTCPPPKSYTSALWIKEQKPETSAGVHYEPGRWLIIFRQQLIQQLPILRFNVARKSFINGSRYPPYTSTLNQVNQLSTTDCGTSLDDPCLKKMRQCFVRFLRVALFVPYSVYMRIICTCTYMYNWSKCDKYSVTETLIKVNS